MLQSHTPLAILRTLATVALLGCSPIAPSVQKVKLVASSHVEAVRKTEVVTLSLKTVCLARGDLIQSDSRALWNDILSTSILSVSIDEAAWDTWIATGQADLYLALPVTDLKEPRPVAHQIVFETLLTEDEIVASRLRDVISTTITYTDGPTWHLSVDTTVPAEAWGTFSRKLISTTLVFH